MRVERRNLHEPEATPNVQVLAQLRIAKRMEPDSLALLTSVAVAMTALGSQGAACSLLYPTRDAIATAVSERLPNTPALLAAERISIAAEGKHPRTP